MKSPVAVFLFLLIGIAITVLVAQNRQDIRMRASGSEPTLSIAPSTRTTTSGDTFSLGITLNTNADTVSAAELHLTYDPSAVQIEAVTAGSALPVVLVPASYSGGTISFTLGSQPTSPFKGSAVIATIQLKALTTKSSAVNFASTTAVASLGKTTNTLESTTGSQLTVPESTPTTPSPTSVAFTPTATKPPSGPLKKTPTPITGAPTRSQGSFGSLAGFPGGAAGQGTSTPPPPIQAEQGPSGPWELIINFFRTLLQVFTGRLK